MNDATSLLRALRPDSDFTPDEAALERILLAPPLPRGRRRRPRALVLAGAVGIAAIAVALAPSLRSSPDVVARAAAALNDPDTILHLKSVDAAGNTVETWQADGGRKERWLYRGGTGNAVESTDDWDTKTALSYSAQNDELITHTEPDFFNKDSRVGSLSDGGAGSHVFDDLALLLDRARAGAGNVHLIGETNVRDIPVYELRIDYSMQVIDLPANGGAVTDPTGLPAHTEQMHRTVYISRDSYLPVRIVEDYPAPGTPAGRVKPVTDYVVAERLPRTPANEALLRMSPHPGAKQVTEGRL